MADKVDGDVKRLLRQYPDVFQVIDQEDRKKLYCKLTKHELPYSLSSIESYINGKKFQRLVSKVKSIHIIDKVIEGPYKDFFLPSRKSKSCLFCTLTKKEINNLPHEIEQHVTGYRFKKAFYLKKEAARLGVDTADMIDKEKNSSSSIEEEIIIPDFVLNSDIDEEEDNEDCTIEVAATDKKKNLDERSDLNIAMHTTMLYDVHSEIKTKHDIPEAKSQKKKKRKLVIDGNPSTKLKHKKKILKNN